MRTRLLARRVRQGAIGPGELCTTAASAGDGKAENRPYLFIGARTPMRQSPLFRIASCGCRRGDSSRLCPRAGPEFRGPRGRQVLHRWACTSTLRPADEPQRDVRRKLRLNGARHEIYRNWIRPLVN